MRKILKHHFEKKIHFFWGKFCEISWNTAEFCKKMHNFRGGVCKFHDISQFYNSFRVLGPCYTMRDHFMLLLPCEIQNSAKFREKYTNCTQGGSKILQTFWRGVSNFVTFCKTPLRITWNFVKFCRIPRKICIITDTSGFFS